jgi:parallel beta-helix repeat protein
LANAATVSVDCDAGDTITAALGNVKPGDTVLVSGTCNEQVSFAPEMVRITLDGQKKTTIQHPGKGAPSPHAVFIRGKDVTIKGITVVGGLDGIHLSGPASAELDGNVVSKAARAGIHIDKGSVVRVLDNTVQENGAFGIDITGISLAYIGVRIPRVPALSPNTIRNNGGPGINIERSSAAWIVGNTISNNKGSGIVVHRNSQADVMANAINANGGDAITASYNGGVNLKSEPRSDGPNQTAQNNGGAGIKCMVGGYVDGPLGTLAGTRGAKDFDNSCVDRVER